MTIGNKICSVRSKEGMTLKEFAAKLNVSANTVSRWEQGESMPRRATLFRIEKLFQLADSYFIVDRKSDGSSAVKTVKIQNRQEDEEFALLLDRFHELDESKQNQLIGYLERLRARA